MLSWAALVSRLSSLCFGGGRQRGAGGGRSLSLSHPDHWWYKAREILLPAIMRSWLPEAAIVMDVGSADAPSSRWLRSHGFVLSIDRDLESISVGGLCADVARLPVAARSVDVIAAFDVIEHLADPGQALQEFRRVLKRDGVLLLSVPAYEWAWTDLDRQWGHHRRFARGKLTPLLTQQGFDVCRATYVFALTFPLFVAHRMTARHRRGSAGAGAGSKWATVILVAIARLEGRLLSHVNMPFGSSLVAVARVRPQPAPSEWA